MNGSEVSSSIIRKLLREGNLENANTMLSRNWSIMSTVIHGEKKREKLVLEQLI